jgi:hypothetical protein
MQVEAGWFHDEAVGCVAVDIQGYLVSGAGTGACQRSRESRCYRAVQVPANDSLHLRVLGNHSCESVTISKTDPVHVPNTG